jgi:uncharacterized caspase-like protein
MGMHVVLIGIDQYRDSSIRKLSYASEDVRRLERCFRSCRLASDITTRTLIGADATRENILRAIGTELPRIVARDDIILIYFACHGAPELVGRDAVARYLICYDTDYTSLIATSLDVNLDLQRLAARLPASVVLFVTDACYSGYSGGRGIIGPVLAEQRAHRRAGLRLSDLRLGQGTVFLGAASDNEVAWEASSLRHGVFSYFFIEQLTGSGDGNSIGISTLYDRVHGKVSSYTRGRQNPVLFGTIRGAHLPILV